VGISKNRINSWVIGFWPSDKPKYAFAMMMESGPSTSEVGASLVMRTAIDEIEKEAPQYFK
jgi:penicillin-binding protein 2